MIRHLRPFLLMGAMVCVSGAVELSPPLQKLFLAVLNLGLLVLLWKEIR